MAIAQMAKITIVTHRSQAQPLLEKLQSAGICQILNAEEAVVSKEMPELAPAAERPREIEELLLRIDKSIAFLKQYADTEKGLAGILAPRVVVDEKSYRDVVSDPKVLKVVHQAEHIESAIEKLKTNRDGIISALEMLAPWRSLETPVEEIRELTLAAAMAGMVPAQQFERATLQLAELGAVIQRVGEANNKYACLVLCLKDSAGQVQKLLRSVDFEPVSFEPMTGTAKEQIERHRAKLEETLQRLHEEYEEAKLLSKELVKLRILSDHYSNLIKREQTRMTAPATELTVILEGWVRKKDIAGLKKIVSQVGAAVVTEIERAAGEETPVEIENRRIVKPFEVVTRLYGMPQYFNIDPTAFLAPFFTVFFSLCLADAGYGLVMIVIAAFLIKKMQGDRKLLWMFVICGAATMAFGVLTGGWFGDGIQKFAPGLEAFRRRLMWFDPFERPMLFFGLALGLGYFQILAGLTIAFVHNLRQKDFVAAVFDQLVWLVMLNSVVILGLGKFGVLPAKVGNIFGYIAIVPAVMIFLFSHRQGGWGARLGMGFYNLFSSIFYLGDVLSYLRLMALGMVGAGLAMAINMIAKITYTIPYGFGILAMILVLVCGHLGNLVLSALSAFVHTLRLQYVEFFPKFLVSGGKIFEPLTKEYQHIYIKKEQGQSS